jgi:hypothetical protein
MRGFRVMEDRSDLAAHVIVPAKLEIGRIRWSLSGPGLPDGVRTGAKVREGRVMFGQDGAGWS